MIKDNSREKNNSQEERNRRGKKNVLKYWLGAIVILVLLFVVYLLWLILLRPEPAVECVTMKEALARIPKGIPDESRSFVDSQVIVTGPASAVEQVVRDTKAFKLDLIRKCDLNYLGELSGQEDRDRQYFPFPYNAREDLTTRLYHIRDRQPVVDVVKAINQAGRGHRVYADPNLLIGLLQRNVCGDPNSEGGSPFNGAPKLLPVGEEAAVKLFWEQWAFRQAGVGPSIKDALAGAAIMHQGEGVLVGVFDTSPFPDPWNDLVNGKEVAAIETQEMVKWVNPAMDVERLALKVSYPEVVNTIAAADRPDEVDPGTVDDVRDHGLFVAGLVHAVSPASEVRLIRVLNEIGCGDLFTLNEALGRFASEVKNERGTLEGVVINLSLGIHDPEAGFTPDECGQEDPEDDIVSLCTVLSDAYNDGAVIVAAAGNDSDDDSEALPAQIPAAYNFVIGVKANNRDGKLACFSNEGDVLAPGGDGGRLDEKPCVPKIQDCSGDCSEAVIGPVLFPPEGAAYWPTHYGYWSGTSFSAPLVSGLAALVLQAGVTPAGGGDVPEARRLNQDVVTRAIQCGAVPTSDGVINVPNTLTDCLP
jgi:hypothetical protein